MNFKQPAPPGFPPAAQQPEEGECDENTEGQDERDIGADDSTRILFVNVSHYGPMAESFLDKFRGG